MLEKTDPCAICKHTRGWHNAEYGYCQVRGCQRCPRFVNSIDLNAKDLKDYGREHLDVPDTSIEPKKEHQGQ